MERDKRRSTHQLPIGLCRGRLIALAGGAALLLLLTAGALNAAETPFNGLDMSLSNLARLSDARTRSISPENFTGEKGKGGMATEGTGQNAGRELGQGWKISPSVRIDAGQTFTMADINGSGAIQHIWMTPTGDNRLNILRIYWDQEEAPSVECPAGDFFACGMGEYTQVTSLPVCVNPGSGFNCYWTMPFRKSCRITMTNLDEKAMILYYQIDYTLTHVPDDMAYFHAQFRRVNPLPYKDVHTLVEGIKGRGQYVGTYMTWGSNSPRLVGRRRDQVLHGRRSGVPHDLRDGNGGLLLRLVRFHGTGDSRLSGIQHAVCGHAPGDPVREAAAIQSLSLAHHGPGPFRAGPESDHAGPGLAKRGTLPAVAG